MFRPKLMSRLLIVASKEHLQAVIQELYSHRIFHIRNFVEGKEEGSEGLSIGSPLAGASEASAKLIKIRSIESTFGFRSEDIEPRHRRPAAELRKILDRDLTAIDREVEELLGRRARIEASLREHEQQTKEIAPFANATLSFEMYRGYESIVVFTGNIARDVDIPVPHEKFFSASKGGNFIAVFTPREFREDVEKILGGGAFSSLPLPKGEGNPKEILAENIRLSDALHSELAGIDKRITELKEQQAEFLAACEEFLTSEVEKTEAPLRFAVTDQAFIAEGWVLANEVERIKSGLSVATGGKALVRELPEDEHHLPPVEYNNVPYAQPTQLLMDTYSRPRYDELDPTLIVSIIFPIFFGIILGDVGYGALLLVMSYGLRRFLKSTEGKWLLDTLRNASISSIIFGVLFSEVFGFEIRLGEMVWHPILFARHLNIGGEAAEGGGPDISGLLMFAIWIGILQITLGRVLSAVNHFRHHGIRGAVPQAGWISVMWGILFLIWSMFPFPLMPDLTGSPSLALGLSGPGFLGAALLIGGVVAILTESALELVEIPTIISHTMSYARLVAVGLSSVAIAMVVNFIAIGMMIEPNLEQLSAVGILFIIGGIVVLIFGHIGNTALGLVGGGLQSLRLQYVEFFTKFYKGGGEKYNPFGMLKRFTED